MKYITLLGATGSIGLQTLDVIRQHQDLFTVHALAFGKNIAKAIPLIKEFKPKKIVVQDWETLQRLEMEYATSEILVGNEGMIEVSMDCETDILVNAVLGSVGLDATLRAIEANKTIAIANKETLVTAGHLVMEKARKHQVHLLPIDSEHSAIFQCLQGENNKEINRLILTASGGSFRDKTRAELEYVTLEDALQHPNWSMGAKVTIDSATMMNKGLEVIEAHWLFGVSYQAIDVILHKESIVHSMVEFDDKSIMAQLGTTDMRTPIQYALTYPSRLPLPQTNSLDLIEIGKLHFEEMKFERFPCLKMAYEAGKTGGTMPTVLNAANEAAVSLFLQKKISFLQIEKLVENELTQHYVIDHPELEAIQVIDKETRKRVVSSVK
ncbi:1-deoxy-D-xylulose 5-phosphate reductoisomerase 2 [Paraliobacillus quinghaiensis]|uniref:1-deoxy-D-xylulose 5-phosphate reductoisomerase n=1 Tax=Paraliobacillus quinghaiensis TaxID=470815 RepID=A0A917TGM3_9BACI|nr:1-deoxy-D-xylulose-5-phosphate reductoisomerase [Paraliobacillus quinghaiensis]GGM21663.1 1-deoxy-D-xylulose 5-phosphate reductoisomerase 2 [Paraliobacillus quinghaiensis]